MNRRYRLTFHVCKSKEEAERFAAQENSRGTYYKRKHKRATVSEAGDCWGCCPIVWYYE